MGEFSRRLQSLQRRRSSRRAIPHGCAETLNSTGSRSKIVFKPLPQDDPKQRKPDITRARKHLKWEPHVPLAQGLVKTIEYFRKKV
jgi:nucleoside-diphosphate-sugar epimerase